MGVNTPVTTCPTYGEVSNMDWEVCEGISTRINIRSSEERKTNFEYSDVMTLITPLASIIVEHPNQYVLVNGINCLVEICRKGRVDTKLVFKNRIEADLQQFSNFHEETLSYTNNSGKLTHSTGSGNIGRPRQERMKSRVELEKQNCGARGVGGGGGNKKYI